MTLLTWTRPRGLHLLVVCSLLLLMLQTLGASGMTLVPTHPSKVYAAPSPLRLVPYRSVAPAVGPSYKFVTHVINPTLAGAGAYDSALGLYLEATRDRIIGVNLSTGAIYTLARYDYTQRPLGVLYDPLTRQGVAALSADFPNATVIYPSGTANTFQLYPTAVGGAIQAFGYIPSTGRVVFLDNSGNLTQLTGNGSCCRHFFKSYPTTLAIDVSGGLLFLGGPSMPGKITIFDSNTNSELGTIALPASQAAGRGTIDPVGNRIYLPLVNINTHAGFVAVIDPLTLGIIKEISVGQNPVDAAFDPVSQLVFVANEDSGTVSVINTTTQSVTSTLSVSSRPYTLFVDPNTGDVGVSFLSSAPDGVLTQRAVYNVWFNETGLSSGRAWNVTAGAAVQSITTPSMLFHAIGNGSWSYTVGQVLGYLAAPASGTITVNGTALTYNIVFTPLAQAFQYSKFVGWFLTNYSFTNVIGALTAYGSSLPNAVYAIGGGQNVTLTGGTLSAAYTGNFNMGTLTQSSSTVEVISYFNGGKIAYANETFAMAWTPAWAATLIGLSGVQETDTITGTWANSYTLAASKLVPLGSDLQITPNLQLFAEKFQVSPPITASFNFSSLGSASITLSGSFQGGPPAIDIASVEAKVTLGFAVSGTANLNLATHQISWVSSSVTLTIGSEVSVSFPIAGFTLKVAGQSFTIGLVADVAFDASGSLGFQLTPSGTSGLTLTLSSASFSFGLKVDLKLSAADVVSITGGGSVSITINLAANPPSVSGYTVNGDLFLTGCVIGLCATIHYPMSYTHNGPVAPPGGFRIQPLVLTNLTGTLSNFTHISRFYNTSTYEQATWHGGAFNGTWVHNVFPYSSPSFAVGQQGEVYLLQPIDNVSRPASRGLSFATFAFDTATNRLEPFPAPPVPQLAVSGATFTALDGGQFVAFWDGIPYSQENLTNPFNFGHTILQSSYFHPSTNSWDPVVNWTTWGIPQSTRVAHQGVYNKLLVLVEATPFASSGNLLEYNMSRGVLFHNDSVTGAASIDSVSPNGVYAVLKMQDDSFEAINVTSGAVFALPTHARFAIQSVSWITGSNTSVAILYSSNVSDAIEVYSLTASTNLSYAALPAGTGEVRVFLYNGLYSVAYNVGSVLWVQQIVGQAMLTLGTVRETNITALQVVEFGPKLVLLSTTNAHNATRPLLNISLTEIPISTPPAPSLSITHYAPTNVTLAWSVANSTTYGVSGYNLYAGHTTSSLQQIAQYGASTLSAKINASWQGAYYYAVTALNSVGNGSYSRAVAVYTVAMEQVGVPAGTIWKVTLGSEVRQEKGRQLLFLMANGTYNFTVTPVTGRTTWPGSGRVNVVGAPMQEAITFTLNGVKAFPLRFNETGLPLGTVWGVTIANRTQSSNNASATMWMSNGTYTFTVGNVSGYTSSPSTGSLHVTGSGLSTAITFSKSHLYRLTPSGGGRPVPDPGSWVPAGTPSTNPRGTVPVVVQAWCPRGSRWGRNGLAVSQG